MFYLFANNMQFYDLIMVKRINIFETLEKSIDNACFLSLCRQAIRNNLKQHDPYNV
jgi:hypothetical protein